MTAIYRRGYLIVGVDQTTPLPDIPAGAAQAEQAAAYGGVGRKQ